MIPFVQNAALVAQFYRVKNIADSRPAKKRARIIEELDLCPDFDMDGHVAKIKKMANSGTLQGELSILHDLEPI